MSTQNKQARERNQKIVLELALLPGNNICADCKARLPRWTSYSLGIFICVNCASIHRKIGTHITKVKSLTMDDWTREQVETMRSMGNARSNAIYNPNEIRNPPPPNLEDSERDSEIEQYIRAKYEYKKFLDKAALAASKLGPSRSASLAPPHSAPLPQTAPLPQSNPHVTKPPIAAPSAPIPPHTAPPKLPPQVLPMAQPPRPSGGVWDDINSLKNNGQDSSLPLQYQQQPTYSQGNPLLQLPTASSGAIGANGYPVGLTTSGMGLNPYQPNQVRMNPFSQEPSQSLFAGSSMTSPFAVTPPMSSQPFAQQPFSPIPQYSAPLVHQPVPPAYFQSQPQTSMQIQNPSGQGFLSASPNLLSAAQSQFPSQSPQQQYISHSPQQMQPSPSPQFMYPNPTSAQPQMGGQNVSGHSQFLGMTTMQMQQQQQQQALQQQQQQRALQQQQQQQQQQLQQQMHQQQLGQNYHPSMQPQMISGPVNGVYGQTPMYAQGGFPSQTGGQWGTM